MPSLTILIADDHELIRHGLRHVLSRQAEWEVCAEAADGREAIALARQYTPDIVIMDYTMPGINGLEATREIRKVCPQTEVLILTMHEAEYLVKEVLDSGAKGYLLKTDATRHLLTAIETLARHEPYFVGRVATIVLQGFLAAKGQATEQRGPLVQLTARERQIVQMIAEGQTNKQVAAELGVSVKTVDAHRANIMEKLGLHSTADLVRYAIRNQIIQP